MRTRNSLYCITVAFILFAIFTSSITYIPKNVPEAYWGYVFIDSQPAPAGTQVQVLSSSTGELVGSGVVSDDTGLYTVLVVFDNDLDNVTDEGADEGERLTWFVGGLEASVPSAGEDVASSGNHNTDFNVSFNSAPGSGGKRPSIIYILLLGFLVLVLVILIFLFKYLIHSGR
ncbi:MAG: hypothetical protein ABH834_02390 [Candidatus Altiarchaeota archaeon]